MAEKTKDYVLKAGLKHSYIKDGEHVSVVGDGEATIPLTEDQARNFKDRLVRNDEAIVTEDAVSATKTGTPSNGASSGASAASAGTPNAASEEDAEVVVSDKKDDGKKSSSKS